MTESLKPCPFCGEKIILLQEISGEFWVEHDEHDVNAKVRCIQHMYLYADTEEEVIAMLNKRV